MGVQGETFLLIYKQSAVTQYHWLTEVVAQGALELLILLAPPLQFWGGRCATTPVYAVLGMALKISFI